jgi:hypothetical protein
MRLISAGSLVRAQSGPFPKGGPSVPRPTQGRPIAEHRHSRLCTKRSFLPVFCRAWGASDPCLRAGIRSGLALSDVWRSTNTGLPPASRRRCRSLHRAVRPFVKERKTDEIHRLRHRPHRAVARGPRKAPAVLSMPYGQRRDTTAPRGWHIPIHARACA